jgi:hypothetical protein
MRFVIGTADSKNIKVDAMILSDTRALFNASSGLGKSWLLRLTAEHVASSIQTIIVDPEGEYPTLREKLDILIVSENGDLRADIRSARLLARRLAETGVSAVIDLYELPGKDDPWLKRRMFVSEFVSELMNLPKSLYHPMLVMVDEAHQFAQEKPSGDSMMWNGKKVYPAMLSRSAIRSMMSAGRKRGIGGLLATQRISKIDKDSIADVRNYFIGGSTLDIDQQRAGDILGMSKAESVTLRDLDPGMFYAFGPAIDGKGVIKFTSGQVQTTHPKAGQRGSIVVPKASTQIAGIVEQIGDLPAIAEEEAQTIETLKKDNADLRRQLRERPVEVKPETRIERVEVPVLPQEQYDAILNSLSHLQEHAEDIKAVAETIYKYPDEIKTTLNNLQQTIEKYSTSVPTINSMRAKMGTEPIMGADHIRGRDRTVKQIVNTAPPPRPVSDVLQNGLTGPMQRILDAMAWLESVGLFRHKRSIVALLAGYSASSTGFTIPLGLLRKSGLITYPDSETADLTDAGRAAANPEPAPLTTEELHRKIFAKLSGPQGRILKPLIEKYPQPMNREELANQAGYSATSTGFTIPLGNLRTMGLIDYPSSSEAIALPVLFLEK